jgi:hypothetical protein
MVCVGASKKHMNDGTSMKHDELGHMRYLVPMRKKVY